VITHAPITASPPPGVTAPAELDLEARLVLTDAITTARLACAAVEFEVNTAHIPVGDLAEVTAPLPLTPTLTPAPYSAPLAATLHRAARRLEAAGLCIGALRDEQGAVCSIGAIRIEAVSRAEADDACAVLLEVIQQHFPDVETVPSWNDAQRDPRMPARYLDRAAELAHSRKL
jgi:hypothetical protein